MSIPLLTIKLYIPPARAGLVSRPRLLDLLYSSQAQPGSFVLLSGPAGFGKTTLLSEFAERVRGSAAWLSLDEGDNDSIRFWSYLIAALQTVEPGLGETAVALFQSPQPPPGEVIATQLINEISKLERDLILFLDDYHAIQNEAIQTAVVFLLEHLPNHLHVIVSTRIDPPWPLARFRARNRLLEIRARDLRFTLAEAATFLGQMTGLDLAAADVAALEERTEGWVAGLQLAALSMKGRGDISGFVKSFSGSHVYIAEFLVEEVLKRQAEEAQEFLLQTSILERLSASLCETVTGRADAQATLLDLFRANLFVVALDDESEWFRYHHLFADLLKARLLRSRSKDAVAELHRRAAGWYEQAGMASEAVDHALAAEDYPNLVRLVEALALPTILQANVQTVERWLQSIPAVYAEKSPRINMAYSWLNLLRGALPQALPYIERLKDIFSSSGREDDPPSVQGEWLAIQSEYLLASGKPEEGRDLAKRTLKLLPEVDAYVRRMIYLSMAKAFQLTLEYDQAASVFQMIAQDARETGDVVFEILGISGEAQMCLKLGWLRRGFEIAMQGVQCLERSGASIPFGATLYGELGQIYYYWHQPEQARHYLQLSMQLSGQHGYSDPEIYYHLTLSKMYQMESDQEAATSEMEKASRLASQVPPAMIKANVIAQQVRVDLSLDRVAAAEKLLEADGFLFDRPFCFPNLPPGSHITFDTGLLCNSALRILLHHARRQMDRSELSRAIDLAGLVFDRELHCQHNPLALEALLLRSQLLAASGDIGQSLDELTRALELAQPEGYISTFVEEGRPVAEALSSLAQRGLPAALRADFFQEILAAFPRDYFPQAEMRHPTPPEGDVTTTSGELVEQLSPRELEVLHLIAAGDSNQQIAAKLVITVSAVKKHTGNIFGKLTVNSRTQAVARARQLKLL